MTELNLCVLSDFHCHSKGLCNDEGIPVKDSYLITDDPEQLRSQNPLISFIDFLKEKKPNVDFLIIPGDLTSRSELIGLTACWDHIINLKDELDCKDVIVTLGNHDVDSRGKNFENPLDLPKAVNNGFPHLDNELNAFFWETGFALRQFDDVNFLMYNSSFDHTNNEKSKHGHISDLQLDKLLEYLKSHEIEKRSFNIAVFHHHPISHDRFQGAPADLIHNGRKLIDLLEKFNFNLIIHGHKHDALLSYSPSGTDSIPIFAAGSFAAYKDQILAGGYNTSHFIRLSTEHIKNCKNQGEITTYYFVPGEGWNAFDILYFPHKAGFGCRIIIEELIEQVIIWLDTNDITNFLWRDLLQAFPMINYLTPFDLRRFEEKCNNHNIMFEPVFPSTPVIGSKI
jgi:3',5'-cyclic AMP phosphodiesterase CpdA